MHSAAISTREQTITGRWRIVLPEPVLPAAMLLIAVVTAAALAYGTRAGLGRYEWGIDAIIFVRRVQWMLVSISLLSCLVLVAMVIANRIPAWWLVTLAPVLALFVVRFAPRYSQPTGVLEAPAFVAASHGGAPRGDEWVVGLIFEDEAYAFPYRALYGTPIVVVTDYSKRMLLMWSAHANRALAVHITRDLRPRALEVVSTPADALLIFDQRYGQFISSITGRTIEGDEPIGFASSIPVMKTTWSAWRAQHPKTRVMLAVNTRTGAPAEPMVPRAALPRCATFGSQANTLIALLGTEPPVAVPADFPVNQPLNLIVDQTRVLLVRDPASGILRAFDRRASQDLFPIFSWRSETRRHPEAPLIDSDTRSLWTLSGRAVDGPLKGESLHPIPIEDGLYWGVLKFWYPDLQLIAPAHR